MSNPFLAVHDTNRKRIRGLWQRGEKFYLQVRLPDEKTPRKFPLEAVSLTEAKAAMEAKRTELREGKVPSRSRKPGFAQFAEKYLRILETALRPSKSVRTISGERLVLAKWKKHLAGTRIDQISPAQTAAYRNSRLVEGLAPRTINLHLTVLRNVLAKAVEDGFIKELPRVRGFKTAEALAPARPRLSNQEFEQLARQRSRAAAGTGNCFTTCCAFLDIAAHARRSLCACSGATLISPAGSSAFEIRRRNCPGNGNESRFADAPAGHEATSRPGKFLSVSEPGVWKA